MATTTTTTTSRATERRLSPAMLVGGTFALTTVLGIAIHVGEIVFTDHDPNAPEGAIESIQGIAVAGVVGLVLALVIAIPLSRDPQRAKIGAVVLGSLAIITLPFFWSGAPATLGASAAWLGGLARGSHPQTGVARGFGVVGLVIAVLVIVATVVGGAAGVLFE
jgi:hypothetical protein